MAGFSEIFRALRQTYHYSADLRRWRAEVAPLSEEHRADKALLISNLHGMYGGSKFEALLAAAMRRRGYRPIVLLPARDREIEAVHTALGQTDFLYDSDLITPGDIRRGEAEADALMRRTPALNDLIDYQIGEYRIGRNAMSLALRGLRSGLIEKNRPDHLEAVRRALGISLARIGPYQKLLADITPARALFIERGYSPSAELFDACLSSGVDAVQWVSAPLDGALLFKRYRLENRMQHPLTLSTASWEKIRSETFSQDDAARLLDHHRAIYSTGGLYNRQKLQENKSIVDRQALVESLQLDPEKKIAVIYCHILYDATFFYGKNLFPDYLTWLVETVRAAIRNPNLNWIVKVHPVNLWRSRMDGKPMEQLETIALRDAFGDLPSHIRIMPADTPINTYTLFSTTDYGLTVRGTIGMELPCYGIPVITAGTGRYSGWGFTIDPATPEDYINLLGRLQDISLLPVQQIEAAQRYAHAVLYRRPWPIRGVEIDYDKAGAPLQALKFDVKVTSSVPDEIFGDEALGGVASWIDGNEEDYLISHSDQNDMLRGIVP